MDISYLKKLIRILEKSNVGEIEVEEEGLRIRISKNSLNNIVAVSQPAAVTTHAAPAPASPSAQPAETVPPTAPALPEIKYHEINSPIVGTVYRAPAPDADPYVEVGQIVQKGTVLCIVEAMKLMNEIESDMAGRIVKIMVENGQPVEYNQTLFLIEPV
ncbi:MAG: acetyl-CoA carboxylase biotin carboxyl carrier protein [Ignavibacteriae bacterium]|nr:acetyl-CoA carboxylase biotin carboxyl carrier protein [Ignavibacteriota bacterium]